MQILIILPRRLFFIFQKREFCFQGAQSSYNMLISIVRAIKMINKGCGGFVACVMANKNEEVRLEDIPIVREFPCVFVRHT